MLLRKQRRETAVNVNMTPMIDIVFLLLIFFMTVSQVSKINSEPLTLPDQKGSEDQQPATIILNVNSVGQILIAGIVYSTNQLTRYVLAQLETVGNDPRRLKVVLRVDRNGASQSVNEIIRLLTRADVKQVRIAVQTEP